MPDAIVTSGGARVSLHQLINDPGVHLLLQRDTPLQRLPATGGQVHVHRLADRPGRGVLAVRPDGYVGYRSGSVDDARLGAWLRRLGATD